MIDYIVYGEFDINEGNVIKIEYPQKTGINEMVLASYIIPEGTHNIMTDCFCFVTNKKINGEEIMLDSLKNQADQFTQESISYIDLSSAFLSQNLNERVFKLKDIYNYNSYSNQWDNLSISKNLPKDEHIEFLFEKGRKSDLYNIVIRSSLTKEVFYTM